MNIEDIHVGKYYFYEIKVFSQGRIVAVTDDGLVIDDNGKTKLIENSDVVKRLSQNSVEYVIGIKKGFEKVLTKTSDGVYFYCQNKKGIYFYEDGCFFVSSENVIKERFFCKEGLAYILLFCVVFFLIFLILCAEGVMK